MLLFRNPIFWMLIFLTAFVMVTWIFSSVLTPYIFGIVLAYLLDPLVDKLEKLGLVRAVSSILIMLFAVTSIAGVFLLVLPILIVQIESLISAVPGIYDHFLNLIEKLSPSFAEKKLISQTEFLNINKILASSGRSIASGVASYAFAIFDFFVLLLIVPVITFYLLMDWNKIISNCGWYLPTNSSNEIREVLLKIDNVLSGFVRGQLLICAVLAVFYSVSLSALGLSYGLLIGVFAGLISFVPFLGATLGALVALSVATYQFWLLPIFIGYVALIFFVGQLLESNLLTPKLIGASLRLHPVMIMLSVSIGGAFAGLSGVMLAVPLAGILAVLVRQLADQYLAGRFFKGT